MRHKHNLNCLEGGCPSPSQKKPAGPSAPRAPSQPPVDRIRNRVYDEDIDVGEHQIKYDFGPQLTAQEIGTLIKEFNRKEHDLEIERRNINRQSPSAPQQDRQLQQLIWRLNRAVATLREVDTSRLSRLAETKKAAAATEARTTGRETCTCGQRHPFGANFYVSAQDAGRTALLRGPFRTHAEALHALPEAKKEAQDRDLAAVFYHFGTVAMPRSYKKSGVLDKAREAA